MKRIEKIKDRLYNKEFYTKKEWWGENETILTNDEVKKEPLIVRKALATRYTFINMPVEIKPDELIVGIINMGSIGFGRVFPEYALPQEKETAAQSSFTTKSVWGHHPPQYDKVLSIGLSGIKKEINEKIFEESSKDEPDNEKLNLYRAMIISLNGLQDLANRYSELVLKAAQAEKDINRRKELVKIARICSKVPEQPAESFQEALQSFWFVFIGLHSAMEQIPTGRSDQYLYPYLEKDLREGKLTRQEAEELVGSWLAKFSERVQLDPRHWETHMTLEDQIDGGNPDDETLVFEMENDAEYNFGTSANHWLINMIIGGLTRDGKDATNELTYMILDMWAYLEAIVPVLSVRLHKNSPDKLYDACSRILRRGSGEPAIFNDEIIVKGLVKRGIPIEDARDYSNDGCWEVLIPGKSNFAYAHVEVLQLLEYVLNRGYSLVRKRKEGLDTGEPSNFKNFEELYQAYLKHLEDRIERILNNKLNYWTNRYKIAPSPLLSSMMDNCVEKGLDQSNGGARYNLYCLVITGLANFIDSLTAIKKIVYEEKKISMSELVNAIKDNFKDQENLRQMLLNYVPKFGNDDQYVDDVASRFLNDVDIMLSRKSVEKDVDPLILSLAVGTFENYARFGHYLGASADGRLYQETVGSNYSPAIGMDKKGPTAAIKSITHPYLLPYYTGCPLDIQINSNEVEGNEGINRMSGLIKSFIELGGVMLTITGVSEEMLREAQKKPEKYKGLRVRLGGLSAYFIALSKAQQEIIIRRTKHGV
jgi:pyruvate-formate lyase